MIAPFTHKFLKIFLMISFNEVNYLYDGKKNDEWAGIEITPFVFT